MSDSTHVSRKRKQRSSPFVMLSLGLHVAGLAALMAYSPTREALLGKPEPPPPPEERLEGEMLADVTEQIRDINLEKLISAAFEIQSIEQEMQDLREAKAEEYGEFAKGQYEGSLLQLQDTIKKVVAAQTAAIAEASQSKSHEQSADAHRDATSRSQSDAQSGQLTLTDLLDFGGASEPLKKQQDEATAAQVQATQRFATARQLASAVRGTTQRQTELTTKVPQEQQSLAAEQRGLDEALARVADAERQLEAAQQMLGGYTEMVTAAEATPKPADKNQAKAREDDLRNKRQDVKRAQDQVKAKTRELADAKSNVPKREKPLAAAQTRLDELNQQVQSTTSELARTQQQHIDRVSEAVALQEKAKALQEKANEQIAAAIAANEFKGYVPDSGRPEPQSISLAEVSVGEVYEFLVEGEKRVAEGYGQYRATDLAMLTKVSPRRALQQIDIPHTERPTIDRELTEKRITEGEEYRRHAAAVETAVRESDSIVAAAQNMLEQAYATQARGEHGANVSLEERSRRAAAIAKASHEVEGGAEADLSELMRQGSGSSAPVPAPPPDVLTLSARSRNAPNRPVYLDVKRSARTVTASAEAPSGWVYVDSWYTVGPFANPARTNIHRSFGPESTVNLDAVYEGMFGPVRWRFVQSPGPEVRPPNEVEYGIWYAYTELNFEEAQDVWIAVGSDDRSDLWINDMRVWSSSDALKGWQIGEGMRRVHFEKGRNRILYRIENGWHTCAFSLCIYAGAGSAIR